MSASVVDRIRENLERHDGVSLESMEPLANAYGLEVEQVNERLAVCTKLLRKGLRSEAIQQANMRPNLVEWCARLDFPEVDDWLEILQFFQIRAPRALNRDAVRQLQEALVDEQPLEELLRQHRRLAIAKAPLAWRLKVIRRIAKVDAHNPVWREDIEAWEKARLREIPQELDAATRDKNLNDCVALAGELRARDWIIQPPDTLVKSAVSAADRLEHAAQSEQLQLIATALYDAFCAQDEPTCRAQRDAWFTLMQSMKAPPAKELTDSAEPALLWLEELDTEILEIESHLQSVAELEAVLDRGDSILDIQKAYSAATRQGREINPIVERRYRSVIGELQLRARRRVVFRVAGITAAAVLAIVAFGFWQWRSMREREVRTSVAALEQMLTDAKLTEAKQYLDGITASKPHVAASAEIAAIASDLDGRIQAEADRLANFNAYIARADQESPEAIDLSALQKAEEIAANDTEKSAVFRIRRRRQDYDRSVESQQFQALKGELNLLTQEIDRIEGQELIKLPETVLDRTIQRIDDLRTKYAKAGSGGTNLIEALHKRASGLRSALRQATVARRNELNGIKQVKEAASLQSLAQALSGFATLAPDSSLVAEFSEVAKEGSLWSKVTDWNAFVDNANEYLRNKSVDKAQQLLTKLTTLETSIAKNPALEQIPELRATLESIHSRDAALDKLVEQLDMDVRSTLVTLEGIQRDEQETQRLFAYFSYIDPQRNDLARPNYKGLEVVSAADGTVKRASFNGAVTVRPDPKKYFDTLVLELRSNREQLLANWEDEILKAIAAAIKHPELDHKVKEAVIAQLLRAGIEGSHYLSREQKVNLTMLESRLNSDRAWYTAAKPKVTLDPELTSRLTPALASTFKNLSRANAPIVALANSKLDWVGSIQRDDLGKLIAWLPKIPKEDGQLYVMRRTSSTSDSAMLVLAGSVRDGTSVLSGDPVQFVLGRPLFFLRTENN